ncbi:MAG: cyclase family protein [Oscillospiraceae bacterium]|jgi:arylformamidase|nr:cyclase family protein [Oscillospiraceae bacterium]
MKIIDITRELFSAPIYPDDIIPVMERTKHISAECCCNYSQMLLGAHSGTHADAPLHFIEGGADVSTLPNNALIGECQVVETPPGVLTADYVEHCFPPKCERLLIKCAGTEDQHCCLSTDAAEQLAEWGVRLIGTDAPSIAPSGNERKPHVALLRHGIVILENLDLSQVRPGRYFLIAAPLKLEGAEAAPARVFLLTDYIFWTGT